MNPKISVDMNRLKGNYAQTVVAEWLSRGCLVRPVAEGTDIGIDLYCESIIEESPFLHFWVQVKTISSKDISDVGGKSIASYRFKTKHLRYWERQPIPTYAFLVPVDKWPPSLPERIYGISITDYTVRNSLPNSATILLQTANCFDAESIDTDLHQFITEIVPWDTSALLLKRGIVAPIPETQTTLESKFPSGIGFQYLDKVLDSIRDASVHGLYHSMLLERRDSRWHEMRKRFEAVAGLFEEQMHDYGLSMLVRAAHQDGEIEKAKAYVYSAIARIQRDTLLDDQAKREHIEKVSALLKDFQ